MRQDGTTGRPAAALAALLLTCVPGPPAAAGQMPLEVFGNLRRGMPESEVLLRAGAPDLVTSPDGEVFAYGFGSVGPEVRELHYVPEASDHDPQLTIVTIRRGRVAALDRRKIVAPPAALLGAPPGPEAARPGAVPRHDVDVRRERAERTLEAAERYAEVRARIKARDEAAPAGRSPVYRGVDAEGTAYFGDVPPDGADAREQ